MEKQPDERPTKILRDGVPVDVVEVGFSPLHEEWNHYRLSDGTSIKAKLVVASVFRLIERYDDNGNPVYVVRSSTILSADSPEHLRRYPQKS